MSMEQEIYQQQLAQMLHTNAPSLSEQVIQAFRAIPRHLFVDHYYLHQQKEGTPVWTRYEQDESAGWYEQVYSDRALVTRIDQHGRTLSSSSQPGVMAAMLDALDIRPGMRVLEIGTGTGYNAALLVHLAGDAHLITTLDLDSEAIERAKHIIPQVVGEGMTIVQADGSNGYEANAPYDRIIATASTRALPRAWLTQLAPNGIVVGILQPRFAALGGLLKAQKHGERLEGKIRQTASFMELRAVEYTKRRIQIDFHAPLYTSFPCDPHFFQPSALRENHDFAFFLYYDFPDLYAFQKRDTLYFYREACPQGYVVFRQDPSLHVMLYGDRAVACSLWNQLVQAYSVWDRAGQPAIAQYAFEMDEKSQCLSLQTPSSSRLWPFGML
jgi:protein-L-isoaspartate(D-aspartate) O-methyltransferase